MAVHDEIYVYHVPLPDHINEGVLPCLDGFTVYLDESLTYEQRIEKYKHAVEHIGKKHWENKDIQKIESEAHR